jgi:hypothetical protein
MLDCVRFYMIHAFLDSLVKGYLSSFLKLIISFLVLHILLSSIFRICYLLLPSSSMLFKLRTVPRLANRPSAGSEVPHMSE